MKGPLNPEGPKRTKTLRLAPDVLQGIQTLAHEMRTTQTHVVEALVRQALDKRNDDNG